MDRHTAEREQERGASAVADFTAPRPAWRAKARSRCSPRRPVAADVLLLGGDLTDYGLPEECTS